MVGEPLKSIILNNARYWLDQLKAHPDDEPLSQHELRCIAKALEGLVTLPEAWDLTQTLALMVAPYLRRQGYWDDWERALAPLIDQAQRLAKPQAVILLSLQLGAIRHDRGNEKTAIDAYRQAWRLARRSDEQSRYAVALVSLGGLYIQPGYYQRAEILLKKGAGILEHVGDTRRCGYAHNDLGHLYIALRRWDAARATIAWAEQCFLDIDHQPGLASTQNNLGIIAIYTGEWTKAIQHLEAAQQYYRAVDDAYNIAKAQLNASNIYREQGELVEAESACLRAEKTFKTLGNSLELARARHNLGMVYALTGDWKEGVQCFERAIETWRVRSDERNLANSLGELGELYLCEGRRIVARRPLDEAWDLASKHGEHHWASLQQEIRERRDRAYVDEGAKQKPCEVPWGNPPGAS